MEPVTSIGAKHLYAELKKYKDERPLIIEAIATAREHGDLAENAEYHAARERQSFIEGRLIELNNYIANIYVVDLTQVSTKKIVFGTRATLLDLDTNEKIEYNIVSEHESDPNIGWISYKCPLGQQLMGKEKGDIVDNELISKEYKVISIKRMKKIK
jgi:transcription elongation factor GreA